MFNLVLQQLAAIMSSVKNSTQMSHIRFPLWDAIVQLPVRLGSRCCLSGRWCGGVSSSNFRYIVFSVLVCKLIVASQEIWTFSKFQVFQFFLDEGYILFYFIQNFCNYCPREPVRDEVYKRTAVPNFLVASNNTCTVIKLLHLQLYTRLQLCFFLLKINSSLLASNKAL